MRSIPHDNSQEISSSCIMTNVKHPVPEPFIIIILHFFKMLKILKSFKVQKTNVIQCLITFVITICYDQLH